MKYYLDYDFSLMGGDVDFSTAIGEGVKVDIPNCPVTLPQNGFSPEDYQGIFTYAKKFDVDFDPEREKVYLVFDAAMVQVHVFLNGVDLGNKPSGYVEARFDISQAVRKKDNELRIVLSSKEDPAIPPFGKALDYMTFAGLYRPVHVDVLPKTHIEHIRAFAHMDGTLEVKVDVVGDRSSCRLVKSLYDGDTPLSTFEEENTKIEGIVPWDLDNPKLYTLKVSLESPFGTDERETRIGFRDAAFKDDGFHLNGKRMKLVGLNRHQTYPYVGPAMPDQAQRDDATILKEYGIQIVRTSHYPQSEAFLDACDELGILVVDEVPGWQYTGHDKPWRDNFLHFVDAMVDKEINHPSLVLYGVRIDEGQDDDILYEEANRICRQKDPYRQTTGVRNFKNSHLLEDVYGFNDFGGGLIKKSRVKSARSKPYFVSEHNGHVFPTKIEDNQQKRIDHAYNHLRVLEDLFRHEGISASVGWCAFDYNTHCDFGSGDQICYHGVFDINRNPKPAAYAYRMQTAKEPFLFFARPLVPGDTDDALIKHVVLFTNLDYVKFYRGDSYIGTFYPDRKTFPNLPHPPSRHFLQIYACLGREGSHLQGRRLQGRQACDRKGDGLFQPFPLRSPLPEEGPSQQRDLRRRPDPDPLQGRIRSRLPLHSKDVQGGVLRPCRDRRPPDPSRPRWVLHFLCSLQEGERSHSGEGGPGELRGEERNRIHGRLSLPFSCFAAIIILPADEAGFLRGVAQLGSALALGARGHGFKSHRPDHWHEINTYNAAAL